MNKLYFAFIISVFLPNDLVGGPIRPSNGQIINYTHVLFEWDQEPDAIEYHVQVSTDQSFDQIVFTDTSTTTLFIEKDHLNWQDNYYWRIRSLDNFNNLGSWSNPFIFQISSSKFQNINVTINDESLVQDGLTLFGGAFPILQSGIIDKDGNEIVSNRFGMNIFDMMQSSFMPTNEPNLDSTYILDFGDIIELQLVGQESSISELPIKRDGSINIPDIINGIAKPNE